MPDTPHVLSIRSHADEGDRTVLQLAGTVDLATAPSLRDEILSIDDGGTVVIDLREVSFMDSPGLGTLIHCHQVLAERGTQMVVRSPQGDVRELFEVVQAPTYLDLEAPPD